MGGPSCGLAVAKCSLCEDKRRSAPSLTLQGPHHVVKTSMTTRREWECSRSVS